MHAYPCNTDVHSSICTCIGMYTSYMYIHINILMYTLTYSMHVAIRTYIKFYDINICTLNVYLYTGIHKKVSRKHDMSLLTKVMITSMVNVNKQNIYLGPLVNLKRCLKPSALFVPFKK